MTRNQCAKKPLTSLDGSHCNTRKPAICCMLTKGTVQSNLGSVSETPFQAATFIRAPSKQTGTLAIVLVLVLGMLAVREPIELTINSSLLFVLRRGLESFFVPQTFES
jgi:hypothetical protein